MFGLVGQLIASTLHNLSVLYIWNKEFDQALPYCRECLRIKTELVGDSVEAVVRRIMGYQCFGHFVRRKETMFLINPFLKFPTFRNVGPIWGSLATLWNLLRRR